ncbi:hypothetical protein EVG20_g290 [Dentipellis fragilis]|uniref:Ribosomal protein S21 n=1 Tax=Dentipellis fragilis TaxID=205917 RepID=A0A4Y9ZDN5_9AGAM|nr:hypothetical protein EVG20_g290 [Dentipellis fragilis]
MQALVARAAGALSSTATTAFASSSLRASASLSLNRLFATKPSNAEDSVNWAVLDTTYDTQRNVRTTQHVMSAEARWEERSKTVVAGLLPPSNAYAGRSVEVRNGAVTEALRRLQTTLSRNRVQQELRATARHEKKGVKRRRLRSQRWRRRFAHEVRKKVQLVNAIRARGA